MKFNLPYIWAIAWIFTIGFFNKVTFWLVCWSLFCWPYFWGCVCAKYFNIHGVH